MVKSKKIWIADDDDAIRMILDEHLKSDGLDVSSFSDGELLLNELDKDVPDLVIFWKLHLPYEEIYLVLQYVR